MEIFLTKEIINKVLFITKHFGDQNSCLYINNSAIIIESLNPIISTSILIIGQDNNIKGDYIKIKVGTFENLAKLIGEKNNFLTIRSDNLLLYCVSGSRKIETINYSIISLVPNFFSAIEKNPTNEIQIDVEKENLINHVANIPLFNKGLNDINGVIVRDGKMYSTNLTSLFITNTISKLDGMINRSVASIFCDKNVKNPSMFFTDNVAVYKFLLYGQICIIIIPQEYTLINNRLLERMNEHISLINSSIHKFYINVSDIENELDIKFLRHISKEKVDFEISNKTVHIKSQIIDSKISEKFNVDICFDINSDNPIDIKFTINLLDIIKLLEYAKEYSNIEFYILSKKNLLTRFGENIMLFSIENI